MEDWSDAVAELGRAFVVNARERLDRMEQLLDALAALPADTEALRELMRHFHGLGGSGGAFGFASVTVVGRQGEQETGRRLADGGPPSAPEVASWRDLVAAARAALAIPVPSVGPEPEEAPTRDRKRTAPDVLVVDDDASDRSSLERLLVLEGMTVRTAPDRTTAETLVAERMPDAAIVDVRLPDGSGDDFVRWLRSQPGGVAPAVLVVSILGEFLDKVEAIRAGADGFFPKPVDGERLCRRLANLFDRNDPGDPRVLYVEDDPDQAAYVDTVLGAAGYRVRVCEDPRRFEADLNAFQPDLVLVDLLLPGIDGTDLARFVRQDESRASLPVVFLSTQTEVKARIESVRAGGTNPRQAGPGGAPPLHRRGARRASPAPEAAPPPRRADAGAHAYGLPRAGASAPHQGEATPARHDGPRRPRPGSLQDGQRQLRPPGGGPGPPLAGVPPQAEAAPLGRGRALRGGGVRPPPRGPRRGRGRSARGRPPRGVRPGRAPGRRRDPVPRDVQRRRRGARRSRDGRCGVARAADDALYAAKRQGRNRVVRAGGPAAPAGRNVKPASGAPSSS